MVIMLTGCAKSNPRIEFSISDFIENGMFQTKETIFSRYDFDLNKAIVSEESKGNIYTSSETVTLGKDCAPIQFYFVDGECTMLRYRISLPSEETAASAYAVLMSQSKLLRNELTPLCVFEGMDDQYTKFPDDLFISTEDLSTAIDGKEVYDHFWSWILNKYDESEKIWADLLLWLPENGVNAYVEFRVYYADRTLIGS